METKGMEALLLGCADDMADALASGTMTLDMQVRAYDLLDMLMAQDTAQEEEGLRAASEKYRKAFEEAGEALAGLFDASELKLEAKRRLQPLESKLNEARFEAASAASLHEFAKETFEVWQTSGVFARRRALRELRARAGFRLESHRIGNYVAKTFDLMNEARTRFAKAQQAVFAADWSYKIKPGIYEEIYLRLK
ncbi:MAG: hypothetical protein IJB06_02815 [Bacteroidales bacterium]|nr:hypothetical protein [Bacteroidales bacterium]